MAEYSFTPQFANLTGLAALPPVDVTRGGGLEFQPLQAIEVPSAQPELVGQGIANALQSISQGIFGGITAKYQEEKALAKEEREHERALELYGAKKKSENQDFFEKQRAAFIAENSQKIDFPEKLAAFDKAYSGFADRTPDVTPKKRETAAPVTREVVDVKPEDMPQRDFFTDQQEVSAAVKGEPDIVVVPPTTQSLLSEISIPEPVVKTEAPALSGLVPPQPSDPIQKRVLPSGEFKDISTAEQIAGEISNPYWNVVAKTNPRTGGVYLTQEKTTAEKEEKAEKKQAEKEAKSQAIEQEKLDIAKAKEAREKAESEQQMEIRQQKVKDEDKVWATQVEDAAKSLKAIDDVISIIEKNPKSVGKASAAIAAFPLIDTSASRIRNKLNVIQGDTAIRALTAMRIAAPTGAAVGNVSDKDMELFKASEGALDPDTQTDKDILPVLREIYRKRLSIYNESVNALKNKNPEYIPPSTKYTPEDKKTKKKSEDMVSVVSPDGKPGRIPKSQLEQAIAEGYKLKQ